MLTICELKLILIVLKELSLHKYKKNILFNSISIELCWKILKMRAGWKWRTRQT